jgi:hypothetical protein
MARFTRTHQPAPPKEKRPVGRTKKAVEFRETVRQLLERNARHIDKWFLEVANGCARKGIDPDPAKAIDLIAKLAEYAAPKLARMEVIDENPVAPVTSIAITFVDGRAPSAPALPPPVLEAPARVVPTLEAIPARLEPTTEVRKRVKRGRLMGR